MPNRDFVVQLLSQFFYPLLGRTIYQGRCRAAIRLSHRPEPPGHAVHGVVDGLDIGGQHGRRFVLLRNTHRPQRRTYPICTSRSGNVRHRCTGGLSRIQAVLGRVVLGVVVYIFWYFYNRGYQRDPNPDLQFCYRAALKIFTTIQLTRFVSLHQRKLVHKISEALLKDTVYQKQSFLSKESDTKISYSNRICC